MFRPVPSLPLSPTPHPASPVKRMWDNHLKLNRQPKYMAGGKFVGNCDADFRGRGGGVEKDDQIGKPMMVSPPPPRIKCLMQGKSVVLEGQWSCRSWQMQSWVLQGKAAESITILFANKLVKLRPETIRPEDWNNVSLFAAATRSSCSRSSLFETALVRTKDFNLANVGFREVVRPLCTLTSSKILASMNRIAHASFV